MLAQDVRVTIRVNRELKESAEALFDYLGLNMSNAINIFLRKSVDQKGIPFQVNTKGKEGNSRSPLVDSADVRRFSDLNAEEVTQAFKIAVNQDISRKQAEKIPIARYDIESGRAYLECADGTREYI